MGPYGELIPEHSQFEHVKHRIEIWNDIFKHTDQRIAENQGKLLDMYNKDPTDNYDCLNKKVAKIVDRDIAYPLNYK